MGNKEAINEQRKSIVEQIISDMQNHGFDWVRPWSSHMMQQNACSGHVYTGGNRLHLAYVSRLRGYDDPRWCTYHQAQERGWHVRKGAKSAAIEKWKLCHTAKDGGEGEEPTIVSYPVLVGAWRVFNASDIDGIPELGNPDIDHVEDASAPVIETVKASSRCPIIENASIDQAAYSPLRDVVKMPSQKTFSSDESYLRTLLHEMTHSTSVVFGRDLGGGFFSESYAFEELIAELGSVFASSDLGLGCADVDSRHYQNHVAYLQSWVSALQGDPAFLFRAASKADEATAYLMARCEDLR